MENLTKEEQQEKVRKELDQWIRTEKLKSLLDDKDIEKILTDYVTEKGWLSEPL